MNESIEEMEDFIRAHTYERQYETYRLFPKVDESILDDMSANGIPWTEIYKQEHIYLAKMSERTNELLTIFHKHNLYVPFKFKYHQYLKLAMFFIHNDFIISDLSFHDSEHEINPHNRLELFDIKKSDIRKNDDMWMTIWDNGEIDSNVDPTNYLRSFYLLYYNEVGVEELDSYHKNLQQT